MPRHVPDEWLPHFDQILSNPGVTVVVGAVDTGKTTLCSLLANRGLSSGIPTAVVDGDVGQSEIGPPTTVGMGIVDSPIQTLADLEPKALSFVGSTSPVGALLPIVVGTKKLTDRARELDRRLVIVDTTGLVSGTTARRLKTYKIELLRPAHIIALQRNDEAEHFLRFFDTWGECAVHRLSVSPEVKPKSAVLRAQRRSVRFHEYFQNARAHPVRLQDVATSGTWLRTGVPLEPKYLKFASNALQTDVLHGEMVGRSVYAVTSGEYNEQGVEELQQEFGTRSVIVVPAARYLNLILGLTDSRLELLALGIVREINFRSQMMSVITPLRSVSPVRSVRFGVLKLRPDGTEIGHVRPGDI